MLSKIKEVFNSLRKITELFAYIFPWEIFESCVGTSGDFETLLGVDIDRFSHCLTSCFLNKEDYRSIESYNNNFHKIEDIDNKLIVKFNELARKMININIEYDDPRAFATRFVAKCPNSITTR